MISKFCTTKWIKILVQQRERKLRTAEQQVLEKQQAIEIFSSSCLFSKWLEVQDKNVKKDEDYVISKKNKKLKRDVMDYKSGNVFEWKRPMPDLVDNNNSSERDKVSCSYNPVSDSNDRVHAHNNYDRKGGGRNSKRNNNRDKNKLNKQKKQHNNKQTHGYHHDLVRTTPHACGLSPGPSVSGTNGFSQLMPVAIPSSTSLDTGPLEIDLILIDPIVPLSNRYSLLSKDLDIYIKEGAPPRNNGPSIIPITLSSKGNNAPSVDETFLFKTPKGVLQPKEKRKIGRGRRGGRQPQTEQKGENRH